MVDDYNLYFKHAFVDVRDVDLEPFLDSDNLGDVAFAVLCRSGVRSGLKKALARISTAPAAERVGALTTFAALADLRGAGDRVRSAMGR